MNDIQKQLELVKKLTPRPRREFDQFTATTDTTLKRAQLMDQNGDLLRKRIIFLGDDDLTSISSALVQPAAQIQVLEIDRRLVSLIKDTARSKHLAIKVAETDLRHELHRDFVGRFDVVFTDPPYTPSGIALFLNQAIDALKKSPQSRIYLCYGTGERSRERELIIQQIINERGLVIRDKMYAFNHYSGAKSIGSQSSLYILDFTPRTRQVAIDTKRLYTHE